MTTENVAGTLPADNAQPRSTTAQIVGGATRVTLRAASADTVETGPSDGVSRFSQADAIAETRGKSDPIATIRSQNSGRPLSGKDIRGDSLITVGGLDTTVDAAVAAGLIRRTENGGYAAAAESTEEAPQQPEQEPQSNPDKVPDLPEAAHNIVAQYNERVGNIDHTAAFAQVMTDRRLSDDVAGRLAGAMGLEASQVHQAAEALRTAYEQQALQLGGPGADLAYQWASNEEPEMMKQAIKDHVENESGKGYNKVMRAWWASLPDHSPQLVLEAQNAKALGVRREANGTITINIPGIGRTDWKAAVRNRWIGPKS